MFLSQNKPPEPSGGFFLMTTPFTFVLSFAAQLVRPFRSARLGSRPRSPLSWRTRALSFPCVAGYRFIAPITESAPITENARIAEPDLRVEKGIPKAANRLCRFAVSVVAGLLGGALLLGVFLGFDNAGAREWLRRSSTALAPFAHWPCFRWRIYRAIRSRSILSMA